MNNEKQGLVQIEYHLQMAKDSIGDKIDEMADLCEHWKRHREEGRNPTAIRLALIMLSKEIAILAKDNEAKDL